MKNQKCLRTTQLVSMEQEAELSLQERLTMRLHLLACADCRNFRKNAASLRRIMRRYASGDEASTSTFNFPASTAAEGNGQPHHEKDADRR
ncbi:MAG: zf-HC2 domain-containing protein [Lautropia sp.]|nr:zf-HC2 domain-containing protein [Lautropia sp.]